MKSLFIGIAVLLLASPALAAEPVPSSPAKEATASSHGAPAKSAKTPGKRGRASKAVLPQGDLRHCLALKTNEEIIRCSEKR